MQTAAAAVSSPPRPGLSAAKCEFPFPFPLRLVRLVFLISPFTSAAASQTP